MAILFADGSPTGHISDVFAIWLNSLPGQGIHKIKHVELLE